MSQNIHGGSSLASDHIESLWPCSDSCQILPVFLPFLGCAAHCVFCAQDKQTGINMPMTLKNISRLLTDKKNILKAGREKKLQLAFYGGTFTAIPENAWKLCLDFVQECRSEGLIISFRCSTRPDSLDSRRLKQLVENGCSLVELGIQSFNDAALAKTGRNYTSNDCMDAFEKLKDAGIQAGAQLMPGMPGVDEEIFLHDVELALECGAKVLRYYPCMVVEGTLLAGLWRSGKYSPWNLDSTITTLAKAWNMARIAQVRVIRMGLAPEPGLQNSMLAGPSHPSLGSRVMAEALYQTVKGLCEKLINNHGQIKLLVPKSAQGYFWGWQGDMRDKWKSLGICHANIFYHLENKVCLEISGL